MGRDYDLLVLGAGPGGYVAAIRGAQLGLKTAVLERNQVGGVCLNMGCIPTKNLIASAGAYSQIKQLETMGVSSDLSGFDYSKVWGQSREAAATLAKGVQYLLEKNGVTLLSGEGRLTGEHEVTVKSGEKITADHILVATGSRPKEVPGFPADHTQVCTSDDMLLCDSLPKSICIVGGGAIGCEFAYLLNVFGVEVTLVEMTDHLLPNEDAEIAKTLASSFKKKRISLQLKTRAELVEKTAQGVSLKLTNDKGKEKMLQTEKVLLVVGRVPNTEGLGLEELGIVLEKGFVQVEGNYKTNVDSVYAIGDVVPTAMLAHVASKEGEIAVESIAGKHNQGSSFVPFVPGCVYCEPQVAGFGVTEENAGEGVRSFKFMFRGAGKAVAIGRTEGFVKILTDPDGLIVGAHIIGADATELIHELVLAAWKGIPVQELARMVHAHPTLSEAIMECARGYEGWVIHA